MQEKTDLYFENKAKFRYELHLASHLRALTALQQ